MVRKCGLPSTFTGSPRHVHEYAQDAMTDLLAETITGNDGYPFYRRRSTDDGGKSITLKVLNNTIDVDNRWIVPYSPLLIKTYNAHINVEYCNSVKAIKYICKYVNKGSDVAVFGVENTTASNEEVTQYQLGCYISSNEAVWRILSFSIHERYPTVVHLAVHLENGQRVYFTSENVRARAMSPLPATLTEFFTLCRNDTFARTLLYSKYQLILRGIHQQENFSVVNKVEQYKDT
ncbi:uncharacterized protein LOC104236095 [Trichonephila clavata]|uniref:Uncharacterized protein LOC104236095 n=1 Tax=Trichonephila clavata TaxID=2740835 RepID=A0A8X6H859_TRICU|nr:uncharacterized protein LOC104236095 [Trichonephila clavata]